MNKRFHVSIYVGQSYDTRIHTRGFEIYEYAIKYAFDNAQDFVSFSDIMYGITIDDIDALTAYHENMAI